MKSLALNRRTKFDYHILETFEAGLQLLGQEVKSVRTGKTSLKGSFVVLKSSELWLINATVSPYQPKNTPDSYDPERPRRLLMHKKEVSTLIGKLKQKGLTLIPISLYNRHHVIKLKFGLGRGKRKTDKREDIKKREANRLIARALRRKT